MKSLFTTPTPKARRFLGMDEVIQDGDEFWTGTEENGGVGHWHPCKTSVGTRVGLLTFRPDEVRRPI